MKTFESLFAELSEKAQTRPEGSLTVDELDKGTHFMLDHVQVMMIKHGLTLEDVYKHL